MKWLMLLCLNLWALFGVGQNLAEDFLYLGSSFDDEIVGHLERKQDLLLLGSTGKNISNESDVWVAVLDSTFSNANFKSFGTSSNERLVDFTMNQENGDIYLLVSYYSAFSNNGYQSEVWKLDSSLTLIQKLALDHESVFPTLLELDTFNNTLGVFEQKIIDSEQVYYSNIELNSFSITIDSLLLLEGNRKFNDLIVEQNRFVILNDVWTDSNDLQIGLIYFDKNSLNIQTFLFGDSLEDVGANFYRKTDSTFIVSGSSQSLYNTGDYNAFVAHVKENGEVLWLRPQGYKIEGPFEDDFACKAIPSVSGGIYLAITTHTYGLGNGDFHIYELNDGGFYIRGNSFGTADVEELKDFSVLSSGEFVLSGLTEHFGNGGDDALVVRFDTILYGQLKNYITIIDSDIDSSLVVDELLSEEWVKSFGDQISYSFKSKVAELSVFSIEGKLILSASDINDRNGTIDLIQKTAPIVVVAKLEDRIIVKKMIH